MERIRLVESKIIRSTTNTRRERGSLTVRVDRFIANKALNFIDRCAESEDSDISNLASFSGVNDLKYLTAAFWVTWRLNNTLLVNDSILIYNRSQRGAPRQLCNANQ